MPLALFTLLLTSCSSFNQVFDADASALPGSETTSHRTAFIGKIETDNQKIIAQDKTLPAETTKGLFDKKAGVTANLSRVASITLESFGPMQFKYALMLNATVENLTNVVLYKTIDEWFGTRYRYGGTTHRGIDCSAFMQVLGQYAFGWALPRTAHEQYAVMNKVEKDELKEGDFVFFSTRGGVSHVGMYLQNNRFVHSASSRGVMISDLDDNYWAPRIVGFKRMVRTANNTAMLPPEND